jgi:hypothetical protein
MVSSRSKNLKLNATRTAVELREKLDRRLVAYVAAAGAAGIALITVAAPAAAEIVYTKTNLTLDENEVLAIDLNGDGVTDLYFSWGGGSNEVFMQLAPASGNGVVGLRTPPKHNCCSSYPAPLFFGVPIGPGENFRFQPSQRLLTAFASGTPSYGQWTQKTNRYLGLKFKISGQTHYGWIRLSTTPLWGTVTGYAYETIPNKSIKAGYVGGPAVGHRARFADPTEMLAPVGRVPSLGLLARGADSLSIWRREDEQLAVA